MLSLSKGAQPMLSKRYELKFPVSADQKERFLEEAMQGLAPDPHGQHGTYLVSSLYFDSHDFRAYWEKLDGVAYRRKHRLRRYGRRRSGDVEWGAAFMEIKHRRNNTIWKERVELAESGVDAILEDAGQLSRLGGRMLRFPDQRSSTVDAVRRAASAPGFRDVVVVSYQRQAWVGCVDRRLRVTFDGDCRASHPGSGLKGAPPHGAAFVRPGWFVMEIKFDHAIPGWIRGILASQQMRLQRFSKYVSAVQALVSVLPAKPTLRDSPFADGAEQVPKTGDVAEQRALKLRFS
jgi:SPX domain protein involved in polyphosphate accumulation